MFTLMYLDWGVWHFATGECGILPLESVDNTDFPMCKLGDSKSIEDQ